MTQDEIIEMAAEVYGSVHADDIKFAKLVAEHEREACAKWLEEEKDAPYWAELMRARGQE